MKEETIDGT